MRARIITIVMLTTMVLVLFQAGALIAPAAGKPVRCKLSMEVDWVQLKWFGTVTGDIEGSIIITPGEARYPGKTEHFFETWIVETDSGTLEGFDEGVWRFQNCKWVTNGEVTAASGMLSHLLGCRMHTSGTTSEFLGPGQPLTGSGIMQILPST